MLRSPTDEPTPNTPIVFEREVLNVLNIGNAMNVTSGTFTAPRAGMYSFSFTGRSHFTANRMRRRVGVSFLLNGRYTGISWTDDVSEAHYDSFTLQSTFRLKAGDQISLRNELYATGQYIHNMNRLYNKFSGWLIEENMPHSE